jgi:hypothetical protein
VDKAAQYAEAAALFKQAVAEGADEAQARAAYDAAVARIAAIPDIQDAHAIASESPQTPQSAPGVGQGILDKAKAAAGLVGGALKAGAEMSPLGVIGRVVGEDKTARGAVATAAGGATFPPR